MPKPAYGQKITRNQTPPTTPPSYGQKIKVDASA